MDRFDPTLLVKKDHSPETFNEMIHTTATSQKVPVQGEAHEIVIYYPLACGRIDPQSVTRLSPDRVLFRYSNGAEETATRASTDYQAESLTRLFVDSKSRPRAQGQ